MLFFISCKSIKHPSEEMQYWLIQLQKGVEKHHLEDTYADFKIDTPRASNRTLNQFITGFHITEMQETELTTLFEKDEKIIKFSKSGDKRDGIQSSTSSAKAKISPLKSSKH